MKWTRSGVGRGRGRGSAAGECALLRARRRMEPKEVRAALAAYAPRYAVYYSGPDEAPTNWSCGWPCWPARAPRVCSSCGSSLRADRRAVSDLPVV